MAILKCKICGGDLDIGDDAKIIECEYCGTKQTVPDVNNEKKINLFNRANRLRMVGEFDKAEVIYENIIAEFPEEAEAYWGLCLCSYGIEYVDDPATAKKIPTCHRTAFDSLQKNENYELALEYADVVAQKVYRDEAREIDRIMVEILSVSENEKPYDVFICYKETDDKGERTIDSVMAQDIYDALTAKGLKVFFARITLEDKLGRQYEPYIFGALNSAKVMLSIGTKYEYFHAAWVKNEWSRFLKLMAKDKSKVLIPCYKDIDAYDIPEEFQQLQDQDMGKIGAIQDLVRGIEKLIVPENMSNMQGTQQNAQQNAEQITGSNVDALMKRGYMALEDSEWNKAKKYFDQVLNVNAECAEAYLGLAMAENYCTKRAELVLVDMCQNKNYQRTKLFAEHDLLEELIGYEKEFRKQLQIQKQEEEEEKRIENEKNITLCSKKRKDIAKVQNLISAGITFTEAIAVNGTYFVTGKPRKSGSAWEYVDSSKWGNLVNNIALEGYYHVVGLRIEGTVVAFGANEYGECNVSDWTNIVNVCIGYHHTVGLKDDGTVVATGDNEYGQCNVSDWNDIVAVSVGTGPFTLGLKNDGHVVYAGKLLSGFSTADWEEVVAISAGRSHAVGLKLDGRVVAVGSNIREECDVFLWESIVAISAGAYRTVGLKSDGTVVAVGDNKDGHCYTSGWKLFDNFETYEQELENYKREEAERKAREEEARKQQEALEKKKSEYRSQGVCQYCGGAFKGLFSKKCTNCGIEKDY